MHGYLRKESDVLSRRDSDDVLVPQAQDGLDSLKLSVARELGLPGTSSDQQFEKAMDSWKYEIADEIGLRDKINAIGWGNMTSRECGKVGGKMGGRIGGNMVRRMIALAESNLR